MTTPPILNPDAIQALRDLSPDGSTEFLQELVGIYLADTPRQIAQLEEALSRQDAAVAVRATHTIKGSSGNFGAEHFVVLVADMERQAKAGNLSAVAATLPEFKHQFEKVATALKQLAAS